MTKPKIDRVNAINGRVEDQIDPGQMFWDFAVGDRTIYLLGEPAEIIEYDPVAKEYVDRDSTGTATQPYYIGYEDSHLGHRRVTFIASSTPRRTPSWAPWIAESSDRE